MHKPNAKTTHYYGQDTKQTNAAVTKQTNNNNKKTCTLKLKLWSSRAILFVAFNAQTKQHTIMAKTQNKNCSKQNKNCTLKCCDETQSVDFNSDIVRRWLQSCSCVRIPFSFSFWNMAWAGQSLLLICSISVVVKESREAIEAHLSPMTSASCWSVSSSSSQLARLGSSSFLWRSISTGANVHVNIEE